MKDIMYTNNNHSELILVEYSKYFPHRQNYNKIIIK
jgi:hypothetical protein